MSTNEGKNWSNIDSTLGCVSVYSIVEQNDNIYLGTIGNESAIFKSTDYGHSWIRLVTNNEYSFHNVQSMIVEGNQIFAGTIGGLLFSKDNGAHWAFIQHPTKRHKSFNLTSILTTKKELIAITPFEMWSYPLSNIIH